MIPIPKYLIETDILIQHLTTKNPFDSYLVKLMQMGICFTSVLNASEILLHSNSDYEIKKIKELLFAIKVLGIPSRYSLLIPDHSNRFNNTRDALFYILAQMNKLTIITLKPKKYSSIKVSSIHPLDLL
jgi:hypothetical protein